MQVPEVLESSSVPRSRTALGLVTLGQSPRIDVEPDLLAVLGPWVDLVQAGALDGAREDEITALAPHPGEAALATRLSDGRGIAVSKERLLPRIEAAIHRVAPLSSAVLILCSGHFPELAPGVRVLYPDGILEGAVRGLLGAGGSLGVVAPLHSQARLAPEKWSALGARVVATAASPYGPDEALEAAVAELERASVDLVLLDCMGFTRRHRQVALLHTSRPVAVATTLTVRVISEVL